MPKIAMQPLPLSVPQIVNLPTAEPEMIAAKAALVVGKPVGPAVYDGLDSESGYVYGTDGRPVVRFHILPD